MATQLVHVRARLEAGDPLGAEDRMTLLVLLGLVQSPAIRRHSRVARRNRLLRMLAEAYCPGEPRATQAGRIAALAKGYYASGWVRDRQQAGLPERLADKPERFLWLAFKTDVAFPFSPRQIDRILK